MCFYNEDIEAIKSVSERLKARIDNKKASQLGVFEELKAVIIDMADILKTVDPDTLIYNRLSMDKKSLEMLLPRILQSANDSLVICDNLVWEPGPNPVPVSAENQ